MKTEAQMREKLAQLKKDLLNPICPVYLEEVIACEIAILEWALDIV